MHRPSLLQVDKLLVELTKVIGDSKVLNNQDLLEGFSGDESGEISVLPDVVVRAKNSSDILNSLRVAHDLNIQTTFRGAGTGKSGGCIPVFGGLVIDTSSMNRIIDIDPKEWIAFVEPGVILSQLHDAVEREGLFYPPDPNSMNTCTLGGNIAENASGPRSFKYGPTRNYVLGLEVCLMNGISMKIGKKTQKGVTGFDLVSLLVGSEGTLAALTQATLKLIPKPETIFTLMVLFEGTQNSSQAMTQILKSKIQPRCLEFFDSSSLDAMRSIGAPIDSSAKSMLLIEVDGSEEECLRMAELLGNKCMDCGASAAYSAQDASQRDRLWKARKNLSHATRALAKYKISEDVVVPRSEISNLVSYTKVLEERSGIQTLCYGHAGEGNIHVNFLWDTPDQELNLKSCLSDLFRKTIELGGTLTGEHGMGLSKKEFLYLEQDNSLIQFQKNLKSVFDPKGLLNPGKMFPKRGHSGC